MGYVQVLRGGLLESRHKVHAAIVNAEGKLIASVGDPNFSSFLRSSAKPFQALAFIPHLEPLGLGSEHLAIAMASHNGEPVHVQTVADLQAKTDVKLEWLVCGTHQPFSASARAALRAVNLKPNVLQHNCSGKHSGMLAACLAKSLPTTGYAQPDHPHQLEIAADIRSLMETDSLEIAIDGCSVPCYRLPLERVALGMTRFAAPETAPKMYQSRLELAFDAMREHPYLIAGEQRIDTSLMQNIPNLISKIGAEAFMVLAVRDTQHGNLGIAMKIEDGTERARDIAILRILEQLEIIAPDNSQLSSYRKTTLKNHAGLLVGEINAAFDLEFR
jgi:L-asparaginase II